jgi:hypothetical protein
MSSDWVRKHKVTNATKGGAPMGVVCVAFRGKKEVSLRQCYWEVSNVFELDS